MSTKPCCPWNRSLLFFAKYLTLRHNVTRWLGLVCLVAAALGAVVWTVQNQWWEKLLPAAMASDASDSDKPNADNSNAEQLSADGQSADGQSSGADSDRLRDDNSPELPVKTFRLANIQPNAMVQRYSGVVTARRTSRLAAKHLGRITHVNVDLGDAVRKGQVLVELDQRELQAEREVLVAQLASAQARLDELQSGPRTQEIEQAEALVRQIQATLELRRANSKRTNALVKTSSVSRQEYDETVTELEATEAQLVTAEKSLELLREGTRKEQIQSQASLVRGLQSQIDKVDVLISDQSIIAPFDGHVQARMMDEGVIVSPGQAILEVVETGQLEVHVGLPAQLVSSGALKAARVICGQVPLPAELERVAPTIDQRTRNLEAVFSVRPAKSPASLPGEDLSSQNCQVECRVGQAVEVEVDVVADRGGWWVPSTALIPANRGLWSVMIVKQSGAAGKGSTSDTGDPPQTSGEATAQALQVELLRSSGDWSQVQGALKGDEWLIWNGLHRITSGQRVVSVPVSADEIGAAVVDDGKAAR